jgi:hypothetical protein
MLFADRTKSVLAQSIDQAKSQIASARMRTAERYEDYLYGEQLKYLKPLPGQDAEDWAAALKITFPFTDLVLGELSMLYKQPPRRWFYMTEEGEYDTEDSPADQQVEKWMDLAEQDEADIDPSLIQLDKRVRLHGRCIVRCHPAYDPSERPADKNYPRFDVFHPGQFDIVADPRYPTRPVAVILYLQTPNTPFAESRVQVWTDEFSVDILNGRPAEPVPNPLKRIPCIGFSNYIDTQEYWTAGYGVKIVEQNAVFDRLWTHALALMVHQTHGQPVAKNPDPKWARNPKWGPNQIVKLDEDGEFRFELVNSNLQGLIDGMEKILERTYWLCGLPPNKLMATDVPESGAAYRLKNASILEDRQMRATVFAPRERALWRLAFDVAAAYIDRSVPIPRKIEIDYAEPQIPVPQAEAMAETSYQLKNHLISVVDEYRRLNPDAGTDEEALEQLRRNAEINLQVMGKRQGGIADYLGGMLARDDEDATRGSLEREGAPGEDEDDEE